MSTESFTENPTLRRNKREDYSNKKVSLPVTGMTCAGCAVSVESMLKAQPGVSDAGVNFANQSAWVDYNPNLTNLSALQKVLQSLGYDLIIDQESGKEKQEKIQAQHYQELKSKTIWASLLSLPIVILGMFFMDFPNANWVMMFLSIPVLWIGRNFYINAFQQAKHKKANMDTLVALSTAIAFLFSVFNTFNPHFFHSRGLHSHVYFEAATVIIAFILLGKLLEEKAKSNTSSAIKKLMGLQPKTVTIYENGNEKEIKISEVKVGDVILVKPGEKIAVDGVVTTGNSFVDESMISGESISVEKMEKSKVFSGAINQKGSFLFKAEKVGGDTILAQIIRMVQEAQGSKAPVQKLVDKIAGIFVPVVLVISILTFFTWLIFGGDNAVSYALMAAVTVLVIACPCALGLATPTAIMVGVGEGAENNILIKDAESLELAHKVNAIILDKTGTITEGKPEVTDIIWFESGNELLHKSVLLEIESKSEHPLAEAIVNKLKSENLKRIDLEDFISVTGKGVKASYQNEDYVVGNKSILEDFNISINDEIWRQVIQFQEAAKTVIYVANQKKILGIVAIADKIKSTSKEAISKLQSVGIEVYMLTGDNEKTAAAVAQTVGIKQYFAEVMPADKAEFVLKLKAEGKTVAMVGDGINDSQALALADVSIAMGKGSDIAMDAAKMTLITSDLNQIPKALRLSKQTVKTINQNLFWAFIYNLIGIPVAAGVLYPGYGFLLDPMIAGAAMALSSVSVVTNSLRLRSLKL